MPEEKAGNGAGQWVRLFKEFRADTCKQHGRDIDMLRSRMDKLEGRLWLLWPIAVAAAVQMVLSVVKLGG